MSKKYFIVFVCLFFLGTGSLLVPAEGLSRDVDFHIGIGINVPPPPAFVVPAPPAVHLIPGSYAYFAPDVGFQLFFHSGYWYRPYKGYWYRASYYNGPWYYLPHARVPYVLTHLPHNYYRIPPGHRLISYGHLNENWHEWDRKHYGWEGDRGKYWYKHRGKDEGRREWKERKPARVNHKR